MTEQELKIALKSPEGGFLFFGDEDYLVSFYANALKKAVCAGDGFADDFNIITIDGEDVASDMGKLLDAVMSPPVMADKKFIELKNPDLNAIAASEDRTASLCEVIEALKVNDYSVLLITVSPELFDAGNLPKRPSNMYKKLSSMMNAVCFDFPAPARLRAWIAKHFAGDGIAVTEAICEELISMCGRSMRTLSLEIDKLTAYTLSHGEKTLTHEVLRDVACSGIEQDQYELANAILDKNKARVFESLRRHKLAKDEPLSVLNGIARVWCDMLVIKAGMEQGFGESDIAAKLKQNEYRVKLYMRAASKVSSAYLEKAVRMCNDADIKLKSTTLGYIAVERLICACL